MLRLRRNTTPPPPTSEKGCLSINVVFISALIGLVNENYERKDGPMNKQSQSLLSLLIALALVLISCRLLTPVPAAEVEQSVA